MTDLAGKRALVTGGSRGIGAAIALALAEKGAAVAITYEHSVERAAQVVEAVARKGGKAVAIKADSGDPAAIQRAVDEVFAIINGQGKRKESILIAQYDRRPPLPPGVEREPWFSESSLTLWS